MKGQINIYQKSEKLECKAVKQPFSLTSVYFKCLCSSLSNLSEKLLICLTTDKSIEKVLNFWKCAIKKKLFYFSPLILKIQISYVGSNIFALFCVNWFFTWVTIYWMFPGYVVANDLATALKYYRASLVAQLVKNLPAMQETWVHSLVQEDPLEKEIAAHSSILAWRIHPMGRGAWQATIHGVSRVGHNLVTKPLPPPVLWVFLGK